jgi:hypothetical protein
MDYLNSAYKHWHQPKKEIRDSDGKLKKGSTHQGFYIPTNPQKYIGDPHLIIYRSGWEFSFCKWCDFSPSIIRWSSEPIKVPYLDKISKLEECKKLGLDPNNPKNWVKKNYNLDFWVEVKKADESIEKWFVEIKPSNKLVRPIPPKQGCSLKEEKQFVIKAKEYITNEAKFIALKTFAERSGAKFYIFTEIQLEKFGIIGGRFDYKK